MSSDLEVLFTVHFLTFLLSEILILMPLFGWYLIRFAPAKAYFQNAKYEQFLQGIAKEYVLAAPCEAGACLYLLKERSSTGEYSTLKELRTAALVRSIATILAGLLPPIALFV